MRPWLYLPLAFFSYVILDLCLRFTYRSLSVMVFYHPAPNLATIGWCLLLTAIACLLPGKVKKVYLGATFLLFAVLTITHSVLRSLFRRFFMFSTLAYAGDGLAFADSQYIKIAPLVLVGVILSLLAMMLAIWLAPAKGEQKPNRPLLAGALAAVLGLGLLVTVGRVWYTSDDVLVWDNYADPAAVYENFTDSTAALLMVGLYQYTFRDLTLSLHIGTEVSAQDRQELEGYAEKRRAVTGIPNDYTGIFSGKNLIMVQLEAIDTWMLTEEYMPNLWKVKQESMVFANHYSPAYIAAGTLNSEFMANTGQLPATGNVSTRVYERNAYPYALANLLRQAGYSAQSFHGSEGNIYSRGAIHPALGYEAYNSGTDMGMEDYTMDSHMMAGYDTIVRQEPFYSFIITYSGHGPYHMETGSYVAHGEAAHALVPEYEGKYIFAVAGAMETDAFIGALMDRLEADGALEDTVLVFYADHYNYYMMNDEQNMALKGVDDLNLLQHTDFFIYAKDREPEQVTKVTSTLDILPTLSNLFGLDSGGAVYLGNDAFSQEGGYVFFTDSSWYDGETYWKRGDEVTELARQRNEEIAAAFRMGNLLLESDYYAP